MILRITDSTEDFGISTYVVSLKNFARKEYHPMIAATKWDRVYIECTDETPRGIIRQLIDTVKVIPVYDKDNVTPKVLTLLCEIAPDYNVQLRSTYMSGKQEFRKLLDSLEEFKWRE